MLRAPGPKAINPPQLETHVQVVVPTPHYAHALSASALTMFYKVLYNYQLMECQGAKFSGPHK